MMQFGNKDFLAQETNIKRPFFNRNQNNIHISPIIRYRKRIEDDNNFLYERPKLFALNEEKNTYDDMKKNDSILLYRERFRRYNHRNRKDNSISDMIISDIQPIEESNETRSIYSNRNMNSPTIKMTPTSRGLSSLNIGNFSKKRLRKKKVNFKRKFVTIINIESYKKYNLENNCLNDKAHANCTCLIY